MFERPHRETPSSHRQHSPARARDRARRRPDRIAPRLLAAAVAIGVALGGGLPTAAQPTLFSKPHFQSPVFAEPGDLVMLPGADLLQDARVFYQYAPDPSAPPPPPVTLPTTNDAWSGELELYDDPASTLDAYVDVPGSLTGRLPMATAMDWPYALHVLDADGTWSQPVFVNDPRPLWLSPDFAYRTAATGSSPRRLRVIGRNLAPLHEDPLLVRLSGPHTYLLFAATAVVTSPLDRYVVEVDLPANLKVGLYRVDLMREGVWYPVVHGDFVVLDDPPAQPTFLPSSYGGCQPNDGLEDAECLQKAIDAAAAAGGGTVLLAPGQWDLFDSAAVGQPKPKDTGVLLIEGVDLVGAAGAPTELVKHPTWLGHTVVTVAGDNEIRNLRFVELPGEDGPTPSASYLRLGRFYQTVPVELRPRTEVENVVIHHCSFEGMTYGIGEGGFPLHRVHITDNVFHAYRNGLYLSGDPNLKLVTFDLADSMIERNLFLPGAFHIGSLGTIASELGAATRLSFRDNIADGTQGDGWRATFFWHQQSNHEMMLVARNLATCTGDQGHDGEAIAFDAQRNVVGFHGGQTVASAWNDGVGVVADWINTDHGFYRGSWVVVVEGPGLGQARRLVDYTPGPAPMLTVEPAWDVVPEPGRSQIVVTRAYWSTYVVDNEIDNRIASGCQGTNPKAQEGLIGSSGWSLDSAFEGNRQYDSGGFHISKQYAAYLLGVESEATGIYATEIRGNLIDGEPPGATVAKGGIEFWHSATSGKPSIILCHDLTIAHNTILGADNSTGGAIGTKVSAGVTSDPYSLTTIHIFRNTIADVPAGIVLSANPVYPQTWRSVLQGNTFVNVGTPWIDNAQETAILP
ncbi:MAG: hypothetical protein KDD11_06670 [Acidobacteria bacterium]|nr:hypothetical protein [Acidobacteriota bacterium]